MTVHNVESMRAVVGEWDSAVRDELPAYARLLPEAEARGSVLQSGAREDDIAAAESRMGITLPPSYRAFLALSDGADAGVLGPSRRERLLEPLTGYRMLSARELGRRDEAVGALVSMWRDAMQEFADKQEPPSAEAAKQVYDFEPGARAVLITEPVQDGIVALVPFPGEWQVWQFFYESVLADQSFATFLARLAREARARVAERRSRVRSGIGGEGFLLDALAAEGDSRAVEVACRRLLEPAYPAKVQQAVALRQIGSPEAVPALRAALGQAEDRLLIAEIVRALDSCNGLDEADVLRELEGRGSPDLVDGFKTYLNRRGGLPRW